MGSVGPGDINPLEHDIAAPDKQLGAVSGGSGAAYSGGPGTPSERFSGGWVDARARRTASTSAQIGCGRAPAILRLRSVSSSSLPCVKPMGRWAGWHMQLLNVRLY